MPRERHALHSGTLLSCLVLLTVALAAAAPPRLEADAAAEPPVSGDSDFFLTVDGLRWYFTWGADKIPTGLDLTVGYRGWSLLPGVQTILQSTIGGGYEGLQTWRGTDYTPHVQIPAEDAAGHDRRLEFNSPKLQWELGMVQGLLWNERLARNRLEAFAFYRGRYERYLGGRVYWGTGESRAASIEAYHDWWKANYAGTDAEGIFETSFLFGLDSNTLVEDLHSRTLDGYYAETSLEVSPWFPSVLGATDFWRVTCSAAYFRTLFRPPGAARGPAVYVGDYFSIDYADARRAMPTYVMQTFGGRRLRYGLGDDAVRGFEGYTWDTQLKIVNNVDLRLNLPPFYRTEGSGRELMPGLLLFFDLGYGTGFWGDPGNTPGGFLGSTGLAVYLDLFELVTVVGNLCVPVIGSRLDGASFVLDLDFGLQF
jgi:hypothetical protein